MANIVNLKRPPTLTRAEALIEEVRTNIFGTQRSYKDIAASVGVAQSTVANLANGKTRWPRPKTLFPLLDTLELEMRLVRKGSK